MRLRAARPRRARADGVLPLINIVFLLLIFFLIAGKLRAPDPFEVAPPEAAAEETPDESGPQLLIGADGALALDGVALEEGALLAALRAQFKQNGPQLLRVKADAAAEAVQVAALLARLRATGPAQTSLIVLRDAR